MLKLSRATKERIERVFRPELRREAARILAEECGNNLPLCEGRDEVGMERIRFAVLKLSGGDLVKLKAWVKDEIRRGYRPPPKASDRAS
jgi:hypothetical protein